MTQYSINSNPNFKDHCFNFQDALFEMECNCENKSMIIIDFGKESK